MKAEQKWLNEQINIHLNSEFDIYNAYAELMGVVLEKAKDLYAPMGLVQKRAKTTASFAEKCLRKKHKYDSPVFELTDLCGGRIIVDNLENVEPICSFIRRHFIIDEENSEDKLKLIQIDKFGYIAVHYVVQIPRGFSKNLGLSPKEKKLVRKIRTKSEGVPPGGRKAEIQIQTQLQNAWAQMFHDRTYKTKVKLPREYKREAARLAAVLEDADRECRTLMNKIDAYKINYGAHMTRSQMEQEIETLTLILENKKLNTDRGQIILRIIKVAKAVGNWKRIIQLAEKYRNIIGEDIRIQLEYGYALCKEFENQAAGKNYRKGQSILRKIALKYKSEEGEVKKYNNAEELITYLSGIPSIKQDETQALALAHLAWTYVKQLQYAPAETLYQLAHLIDKKNPYYFKGMLECSIAIESRSMDLRLFDSQIMLCIECCNEHAQVGIELPYAYFTTAKFHLFRGNMHKCMLDYAKALITSSTEYPINEELTSVCNLLKHCRNYAGLPDVRKSMISKLELIKKFLLAGKIAKLIQLKNDNNDTIVRERYELALAKDKYSDLTKNPDVKGSELTKAGEKYEGLKREIQSRRNRLKRKNETLAKRIDLSLSSKGISNEEGRTMNKEIFTRTLYKLKPKVVQTNPIVYVAGGADPKFNEQLEPYRKTLKKAFEVLTGTVFCGGTKSGVPGMIGQIVKEQRRKDKCGFILYGYIPKRKSLPHDAPPDDENYILIENKQAEGFSYLEPIQNWIDILAARVDPKNVRILGINGGEITEFEYYLGLAMGSTVGLVKGSGRTAATIMKEQTHARTGQLFEMPNDAMTIRAHLFIREGQWLDLSVEQAAMEVHKLHRQMTEKSVEQSWNENSEDLKKSCYHQVKYAEHIFRMMGFEVTKLDPSRKIVDLSTNSKKKTIEKIVKQLARMEHGRWNIERLMQGWKYGKKKNNDKKTSPYIAVWEAVPKDIQQYDIRFVQNLPLVLKKIGIGIYEKKKST